MHVSCPLGSSLYEKMEQLRVTFLGPAASFSHQVRRLEIRIIESILMLRRFTDN